MVEPIQDTTKPAEIPGQSNTSSASSGLRLRLVPAVLLAIVAWAICVTVLRYTFPPLAMSDELVETMRQRVTPAQLAKVAANPPAPMATMGGPPVVIPHDTVAALNATGQYIERGNAMFVFGLLGLAIGGLLCCGEAVARDGGVGRIARAVLAILLCAAGGVAAGCLAMELLFFLEDRFTLNLVFRTWVFQGASMSVLGVGLGVALAVLAGRGLAVSCTLAGLLAGVLAAMAGPLALSIAGIALPTVRAELLLPESFAEQMLWVAVPSLAFALAIPSVVKPRKQDLR